MKLKFTLFLAVFFVLQYNVFSQSFSITEINSDSFPRVRASFIAMKNPTEPFLNLSNLDFTVKENGIDLSPKISVKCEQIQEEPEVSVLLVLDKSGSMDTDSAGIKRLSWVQKACTTFINTLNFQGRTTVGITGFAKDAEYIAPFIGPSMPAPDNNKNNLLDSIRLIRPGGTTQYDPPFLHPLHGAAARLKTRPSNMRRIVIFLTDGQPDIPPHTDSIVKVLTDANIQVYSITLLMPMNDAIRSIAAATGGKSFVVNSEAELDNIYRAIAIDIQTKIFCEVNWISPFGCDESSRYRNVDITFKPLPALVSREYVAPPKSLAKIAVSEEIVDFGNPPSGPATASKRYITISAPQTSFNVKNISITGSNFYQVTDVNFGKGSKTVPFTLDSGTSRIIEVTFTQQDPRVYKQGALVIDALPCSRNVLLSGGASQVRVVNPNGGEVFSLCDSVDIMWTGLDVNQAVNIFISSDNGATWTPAKTNVTKSPYRWKAPQSGVSYKVKVVVAPSYSYQWAKRMGGTLVEAGKSVKVQEDGNYVYLTGFWDGEILFDGKNKTISVGNTRDIYLQRYDLDGNLQWTRTAGGYGADEAVGVTVDEFNNAFITGTTFQGASFGSIKPNMEFAAKRYAFVAKYTQDGNMGRVVTIGAKGNYTKFEAWGLQIKYDKTNAVDPKVLIHGKYTGNFQTTIAGGKILSLPTGNSSDFTAEFDKDLNLTALYQGFTNKGYSSNSDIDLNGNRYDCGSFAGTKTIGTINLTSAGNDDAWISKYGGTPGSEDISDAAFAIDGQKPQFTVKTINVGQGTIGATKSFGASKVIINAGDIIIDDWQLPSFSGANAGDFTLDQAPAKNLKKGEYSDLVINFTPGNIGTRTATLTMYGTCSGPISVDLVGEGVCTGDPEPIVDFSNVNVNMFKEIERTCIFRNPNSSSIQIDPKIVGNNGFYLVNSPGRIFVGPDSCISLKIKFNPAVEGAAVDTLDYGMPAGCENPQTVLKGIGVKSDITIIPVNWDEKRILTNNPGSIIIKNNSALEAEIEYINFVENESEIQFSTGTPVTPIQIPASGQVEFDVEFKPVAERVGPTTKTIAVKFVGRDDTLTAVNTGIGVNPQVRPEWICPAEPVRVGVTSTAVLRLHNESIKKDAKVQKVEFNPVIADYKWETPANALNFDVPFGSYKDLIVTYAPKNAGSVTTDVNVTADVDVGPVPQPWIVKNLKVDCEALSAGGTQKLAFGNWVVCDTGRKDFTLKNEAPQTELRITRIGSEIQGPGKDAFYFDLTRDIVIDKGETRSFEVKFIPTEAKLYTATLILANSQGQDIKIELEGTGVIEKLESKFQRVFLSPGKGKMLPVYMDVPQLDKGSLKNIKVEINYDSDMSQIVDTVFTSTLSNWTWLKPVFVSPGKVWIEGYGNLATPFNGKLFEIGYKIYLGALQESEIFYKIIHETCLTEQESAMIVQLDSVCFLDGRLIQISDTYYNMSEPKPNPALNQTEVEFSLAFDGAAKIEIVNLQGEIINTPVHGYYKKGVYKLSLNVNQFGSGVYYIRYNAGNYSKTNKLLISK